MSLTTVPATMTTEGVTAAALSAITASVALKADDSATVHKTGNETIAGTKTFSNQPVLPQALTQGTVVASTSGTSIDFSSIPSWVKRITVMLNGVSTSGTSRVQIQVGASGSVVTTGYASYTSDGGSTSTAGFILGGATATDTRVGAHVLHLQDAATNKWIGSGVTNSSTSSAYTNVGNVTLAAALDRIRLTTVNGTDTFDAGSVNILYE